MQDQDDSILYHINQCLSKDEMAQMALQNGYHNLARLLGADIPIEPKHKVYVQAACNWCTSEELKQMWDKMRPHNSMIELTNTRAPDFWVILNQPPDNLIDNDPSRTIVFQMEPYMKGNPRWPEKWRDPQGYMRVFRHATDLNCVEWHLSLSYDALLNKSPEKSKVLSTVLSSKYSDPGHVKRVDFVKHIEDIVPIDVYGSDAFLYSNYCGSLPAYTKDNGVLPYKYHFAAENHSIPNYITEKLWDAILGECLCFYWGAPNTAEHINPEAFIQLPLDDFDESLRIIQKAITGNEWEKRIDVIRAEKRRILQEYSFFNRLEHLLIA